MYEHLTTQELEQEHDHLYMKCYLGYNFHEIDLPELKTRNRIELIESISTMLYKIEIMHGMDLPCCDLCRKLYR